MINKELDDLLKDIDEIDEEFKNGKKKPSKNYYIEDNKPFTNEKQDKNKPTKKFEAPPIKKTTQ